jgi:hypothetical protein
MKPYNMLEKTKALFIIILLTLCTVSCTKAETIKTKAESPQASAPSFSADTSSNVTKSRIALNDGDLNNIDKLLLQVNRANQANKDLAAKALERGREAMEQERQKGLHGRRSGLFKTFCAAALNYPTVEALTGCAEAISLTDGNFESKLKNFKSSSKLYRTALLFSDRTNAPLPSAERQKVEKNIACLDAFVKAPNIETPGFDTLRSKDTQIL